MSVVKEPGNLRKDVRCGESFVAAVLSMTLTGCAVTQENIYTSNVGVRDPSIVCLSSGSKIGDLVKHPNGANVKVIEVYGRDSTVCVNAAHPNKAKVQAISLEQIRDEVNEANLRVSRHWLLEYQKTEDLFRIRVAEDSPEAIINALRKVMNELGLAVMGWDSKSDELVSENYGPNPLTGEEWQLVIKKEEQEARKIGGSFFTFSADAKDYFIQVRVKVVTLEREKSAIILNYAIDSPRHRKLGIVPTTVAPPLAVQYASLKIWALLDSHLAAVKKPKSRQRHELERV